MSNDIFNNAPREKLTANVYNVAAFAITADEFRQRALKAFAEKQNQ